VTALTDPARLAELVGTRLGTSDWHVIDQARIDSFAEVTGDRQWLHVDVRRAAAGPFGGTVAHGLLTLGLVPAMLAEVLAGLPVHTLINKGFDRVRFLSPVLAGERVRAQVDVVAVTPRARGFTELVLGVGVWTERAGQEAMTACCRLLLRAAA
jgi:acyl dehydratase